MRKFGCCLNVELVNRVPILGTPASKHSTQVHFDDSSQDQESKHQMANQHGIDHTWDKKTLEEFKALKLLPSNFNCVRGYCSQHNANLFLYEL
jgi:hypothetical protein